MIFDIDYSKYKLVDLSKNVIPNMPTPDDRPFEVTEGRLPDGTYKFDITRTHTHVGTHVESPWHFYHSGNTITDFPIEKFMGKARLFKGKPSDGRENVCVDDLKAQLEAHRGTFSILVIRNDSGSSTVRYDMECVPYIRDLGIDLLVFEMCSCFGYGMDDGCKFHDILMQEQVCFVEFPDELHQLDRDEFFLFAVPVKIHDIDSAMCRLFAVVEK